MLTAPVFFYWFSSLTCLEFSLVFPLLFFYVSRRRIDLVFGALSFCLGMMIWSTYRLEYARQALEGLFWYRTQLISVAFAVATALHFVGKVSLAPISEKQYRAIYGIAGCMTISVFHPALLHLPVAQVPTRDFDNAMAGVAFPLYFLFVFAGGIGLCLLVYSAMQRSRHFVASGISDAPPFMGLLVWLLISFVLILGAGIVEFLQALDIPSKEWDFWINPRALAALIFCFTTAWNLAKQIVAGEKQKSQWQLTAQTRLEATNHIHHQVRNALIGIERPLLTILESDAKNLTLSNADHRRLNRAVEATHHLYQTLDVALNLARVEVGEPLNLGKKESIFIEPFLRQTCRSLIEPEASKTGRKREVRFESEENLPACLVHSDALREVCVALLENALKYSPAGSPLAIRVTLQYNSLWVSITDRGCGVLPTERERIFTRYRGTQSGMTPVEGTGLGLPLARCYVGAWGGAIWVESEGAGRGSSFCFTIPYEPVETEPMSPRLDLSENSRILYGNEKVV